MLHLKTVFDHCIDSSHKGELRDMLRIDAGLVIRIGSTTVSR